MRSQAFIAPAANRDATARQTITQTAFSNPFVVGKEVKMGDRTMIATFAALVVDEVVRDVRASAKSI